jgi:hypothetical protein
MSPHVPEFLGGEFNVSAVSLPGEASRPDRRPFVIRDTLAAGEEERARARMSWNEALANPESAESDLEAARDKLRWAESKHAALLAVLRAEELEEDGWKDSKTWRIAAQAAVEKQRRAAAQEAGLARHQARVAEDRARDEFERARQSVADAEAALASTEEAETLRVREDRLAKRKKDRDEADNKFEEAKAKLAEAGKALAQAEEMLGRELDSDYQTRPQNTFPERSTGRRLALARWIADPENPRTARVAVNHIWLRHFGRGLVPTPADFGGNGRPASHPDLLDWLAAEFMDRHWSMKRLHRLIVTSSAYRMASTRDIANAEIDPDNLYLWRAPSRRMEAELVRDNILHASGDLDPAMGGPEIDHEQGLVSRRRSLYLRIAAEKEVEFLKIFDGPRVTECYARHPTVAPQQALALANSQLTIRQAKHLAAILETETQNDDTQFVSALFRRILARPAEKEELRMCLEFLEKRGEESSLRRARENLVLVLFNHNDFVTIR